MKMEETVRELQGREVRRRRPKSPQSREMLRRKKQAAKRRRRMQRIRLAGMFLLAAVLLGVLVKLVSDSGISFFSEFSLEKEDYLVALLEALEKNPELEEFVKGYPDSDGSVTGEITEEEVARDFPLLLQYDGRWGYVPFGDDMIALSGCAPTCLSMVVTGLTKTAAAPPDVVADFCEKQGYYEKGVGTSWRLMTEGCQEFGVRGEELRLDKNLIFSRLEEGQPVICSMRPGDFTTTGHFIVLVGTEDGKLKVNDPFSRERSSRLWEFEQIQYQIKNLWAFQLAS